MILSIKEQAAIFAISFLCGAGAAFIYDFIKILRIYIKHSVVVVQIEDMSYWLICSFVFFNILIDINAGDMRFYIPSGFFIGMAIYFIVFDKVIVFCLEKVINFIIKCIKLLIEIIITPFKLIWIVIRYPTKIFLNLLFNLLISGRKYVKILNINRNNLKNKIHVNNNKRRR